MNYQTQTPDNGRGRADSRWPFVAGFRVIEIAGVLLLVAGCGAGDRGKVTGTVRLNGQPVGPGTINLEPTGGGPGAMAQFGADGTFRVISSGKKEAPASASIA